MSLTAETEQVINSWVAPAGLIYNDSNVQKIAGFLAKHKAYLTHDNLNLACQALRNELDWAPTSTPATAKPVPSTEPTRKKGSIEERLHGVGVGVDTSRMSHTEMVQADKARAAELDRERA